MQSSTFEKKHKQNQFQPITTHFMYFESWIKIKIKTESSLTISNVKLFEAL